MGQGELASAAPRQRDVAWFLGFTAVLIIIAITLRVLPWSPADAVAVLFLGLSLQLRRGNILRVIPLTLGLVTTILATHLAIEAMWGAEGLERIREAGSLSLKQVLAGELWRIPTHVFLHRDWGHVTGNAIVCLGFGMVIEPALGSRRLAQGLLVALVATSATTLMVVPGCSGFSGITYGMQGILLARPYRGDTSPRQSLDPAWVLAVWLLVRYFVPSQFSDRDASFEAHAGGLIGGLWFGIAWAGTARVTGDRRKLILRLATSSAVALALVGALATNPRWVVTWHASMADQAESVGDVKSALHHWAALDSLAKTGTPVTYTYLLRYRDLLASSGQKPPSRRDVVPTRGP